LVSAPRSCASILTDSGTLAGRNAATTENLRAVQRHLRHADLGTTTIYARLLPQQLQEIVTVFDP
jgi:site-specific recombinase XerC